MLKLGRYWPWKTVSYHLKSLMKSSFRISDCWASSTLRSWFAFHNNAPQSKAVTVNYKIKRFSYLMHPSWRCWHIPSSELMLLRLHYSLSSGLHCNCKLPDRKTFLSWSSRRGLFFYLCKQLDKAEVIIKILTINEWGWVSYEELWRSRRVLSIKAVGRGG